MRPNEMTAPDDLTQRAREVAELAAKATPGPWASGRSQSWAENRVIAPDQSARGTKGPFIICRASNTMRRSSTDQDMAFIAAAHDMASLIADQSAEIERLTKLSEEQGERIRELEAVLGGADRYASTDPQYRGSPFEAQLRAALARSAGHQGEGG